MPSAPRTDPLLFDLNEPQQRAVLHGDGPLLVIAGPGSGKTRVIVRRAAHLVRRGANPGSIVAITFTNKAAGEMRRRLEELDVARGMWVYTFHALGARLLREFGEPVGVRPGFTIYDADDQARAVREAMEQCAVRPEHLRPEQALYEISDAKGRLIDWDAFTADANRSESRTIAEVYEAYAQLLASRNALDFDDLLMKTAILLRDVPESAETLRARFRHLLIDEYQDTNHAQYVIARELSLAHRNICVTGDPDQSIYAWRGADIGNILDFERDFPDAVVVRLEENYRSTQAILSAAGSLIAFNKERRQKALWTRNDSGHEVVVRGFLDGHAEDEHISETIAALNRQGRPYSDFAVMYRVNAISRGIETALRARRIPYKVARGVAFYGRSEIRDTLAYLRLLVNPADDGALTRIINRPARGIGATTVRKLRDAALRDGVPMLEALRRGAPPDVAARARAKLRGFVELIDRLEELADGPAAPAVSGALSMSGLEAELEQDREAGGEDRLANAQELVTAAQDYDDAAGEPTLEEFLAMAALHSDQDAVDESAGVVTLMTLHAAKGLEFPVVFLPAMQQGMLPHERALREGSIEEERRLCFVGMTRARERLYLSYSQCRQLRGRLVPQAMSQFVREIGAPGRSEGESHRFSPKEVGAPRDRSFGDVADECDDGVARRRWRRGEPGDDPDEAVFSPNEPTGRFEAGLSPRPAWREGMLVRHVEYGEGTILRVFAGGRSSGAVIRFDSVGERTLMLDFAPLERLD